MFEFKKTHSGQYKRYGDSFYEWDIKTDLHKDEVLQKCFKDICKLKDDISYPEFKEWQKNICIDGEKRDDIGYYFHGYYTLKEIEGGYHFTVCHPYTD